MSDVYFIISQDEDGDVSYRIFKDKQTLLSEINEYIEDGGSIEGLQRSLDEEDLQFNKNGVASFFSCTNLPTLIIKGNLVTLFEKKIVTQFDVG